MEGWSVKFHDASGQWNPRPQGSTLTTEAYVAAALEAALEARVAFDDQWVKDLRQNEACATMWEKIRQEKRRILKIRDGDPVFLDQTALRCRTGSDPIELIMLPQDVYYGKNPVPTTKGLFMYTQGSSRTKSTATDWE